MSVLTFYSTIRPPPTDVSVTGSWLEWSKSTNIINISQFSYTYFLFIHFTCRMALCTTQKTQSNCISSKHEVSAFQGHSLLQLEAEQISSWNREQEPTSAMLPVSYSAFISVEILILLVTKLLWPSENRRNTYSTCLFGVNFRTICYIIYQILCVFY